MPPDNQIYEDAFSEYMDVIAQRGSAIEWRRNTHGILEPISYQGKSLVGPDIMDDWDGDVDALQTARGAATFHLNAARAHATAREVAESTMPPVVIKEFEVEDTNEVIETETPPDDAGDTEPDPPGYPKLEDYLDPTIEPESARNELAERELQVAIDGWAPNPAPLAVDGVTPRRFVAGADGKIIEIGDPEPPELTPEEAAALSESHRETDPFGNEIGDEAEAFDAAFNELEAAAKDGTGPAVTDQISQSRLDRRDAEVAAHRGVIYVPESARAELGENGSTPEGFEAVAITRSIPTYYRLGYVLESIARNFKQSGADAYVDINFVYKPLPNAPVRIPLPDTVKDEVPIPLKTLLPPDFEGPAGPGQVYAANEGEWDKYLQSVTDIARSGQEFHKSQSVKHELLYTAFDAPLIIKSVNALLSNNPKMNALKLIKAVIALAAQTLNSGQSQSVAFRLDSRVSAGNPNVIEIFSTSNIPQKVEDRIEALIKEGKIEQAKQSALAITYAHNNSLIESIDVASKIDANAWAVFRQDGATNRMGVNLVDRLYDSDEGVFKSGVLPKYIQKIINEVEWTPPHRLTAGEPNVAKITNEKWNALVRDDDLQLKYKTQGELESIKRIALSLSSLRHSGSTPSDENIRLANGALGTLLFTDTLFYNSLLVDFMKDDSNVHLGKVLSNYLLTITATIHGVCGLSPLDHILVDNVIQGVRGIYYISNLEEDLRPGNFNTLITMQLARQL